MEQLQLEGFDWSLTRGKPAFVTCWELECLYRMFGFSKPDWEVAMGGV